MKKPTKLPKIIGLIILISIIICSVFLYLIGPVNNNKTKVLFTIKPNTSTRQIITELKEKRLIKSEFISLVYIRLLDKPIQAGTYELSTSFSTPKILSHLTEGKIYDQSVTLTIPEGKNIYKIAQIISSKTNHSEADVLKQANNKEYLNTKISKYNWLTTDILNPNIYYALEGYLFPDTYIIKNKDVPISDIFDKMLAQTDKILTANKTAINKSDFTVHEIMTMASIVELEGVTDTSRSKIASVFYNRLKIGMSLGSDVTTYYAAKVSMNERDLTKKELNSSNPYNTRGPNMSGKLPVGPVASPGENAIISAISPAITNYLYFVADKNKQVYFTESYSEHNKVIAKLKRDGLWFTYN